MTLFHVDETYTFQKQHLLNLKHEEDLLNRSNLKEKMKGEWIDWDVFFPLPVASFNNYFLAGKVFFVGKTSTIIKSN